MDPGAIVERILGVPRVAYVMSVLDVYGKAAGGLLANGLAFTALFATIPIALVTLGLAGSLIGDPRIQDALATALIETFPPLESLITGALQALSSGAAATSIIGIIGLVWTVSQFYVTLDVAFSRIFSQQRERDPIRRTVRGFAWVVLLLGLVLGLVVLSTILAATRALLPGETLPLAAIGDIVLSLPVMVGIAIGVVAIAYRTLPPRHPRWRSVLVPGIVVGVVLLLLSQLFVFLAPRLVGIAALAGSLAAAFIALAWFSFTFQALLIGAAWVRVREERGESGSGDVPE